MVLGRDRVSDRESERTVPLAQIQEVLSRLYPGVIADNHGIVTNLIHLASDVRECLAELI
jgi:hypothetical protein